MPLEECCLNYIPLTSIPGLVTRFKPTLKVDHISWVSWFAQHRWRLNCIWNKDCSSAFPEFLQNLDLLAMGLRAALSMSGEPRGAGGCWCFLSAAFVLRLQRGAGSSVRDRRQPQLCGALSLSACPRRQFSVCSLFSVVVFAIQPCILLRRWWGLWWGMCWWKGNFTAQTRSQKNTHFSTLGFRESYCCSSSWGLAL